MSTFMDFYVTLLGFVNFRLYLSANLFTRRLYATLMILEESFNLT